MADFAEVPPFGEVPLDPSVREWADKGTPAVQAAPHGEASKAFVEVADARRRGVRGGACESAGRGADRGPQRRDGRKEAPPVTR